ncbi:MAG: superoxide dismutase family protein [Pseudomonadota bacterium]
MSFFIRVMMVCLSLVAVFLGVPPSRAESPNNRPASALLAAVVDRSGTVVGTISATQGPKGVLFKLRIAGLSPGWHGIHLHQVGTCTDWEEGFTASAGHINPFATKHGLLNPMGDHLADLPNIHAGSDGIAVAEIYRPGIGINSQNPSEKVYGILDKDGFAVIVHENPDDHHTQPIGGAGARVACAAFR